MREEGLLTLSDSEWEKARRRADIIRPLAKNESVSRIAADEAAKQLGVSRRHFYELLMLCDPVSNAGFVCLELSKSG
jgi:hypothetical protein